VCPISFSLATDVVLWPVYTAANGKGSARRSNIVTTDDANCCRTVAAFICSTLHGTYFILLVHHHWHDSPL
jgi:hypothetical protein